MQHITYDPYRLAARNCVISLMESQSRRQHNYVISLLHQLRSFFFSSELFRSQTSHHRNDTLYMHPLFSCAYERCQNPTQKCRSHKHSEMLASRGLHVYSTLVVAGGFRCSATKRDHTHNYTITWLHKDHSWAPSSVQRSTYSTHPPGC